MCVLCVCVCVCVCVWREREGRGRGGADWLPGSMDDTQFETIVFVHVMLLCYVVFVIALVTEKSDLIGTRLTDASHTSTHYRNCKKG